FVQPEQVRDGLRPLQLGEQARLEDRRALVERGGEGERGCEYQAVHAFGLPKGRQRKAHPLPKQTAGRTAPFRTPRIVLYRVKRVFATPPGASALDLTEPGRACA